MSRYRNLPFLEKESLTRNICATCQALCDCKGYKIIKDVEFYEEDNFDNSAIQVALRIYFEPNNFTSCGYAFNIKSHTSPDDVYKMIKKAIDKEYKKYIEGKEKRTYLSLPNLLHFSETTRQLSIGE